MDGEDEQLRRGPRRQRQRALRHGIAISAAVAICLLVAWFVRTRFVQRQLTTAEGEKAMVTPLGQEPTQPVPEAQAPSESNAPAIHFAGDAFDQALADLANADAGERAERVLPDVVLMGRERLLKTLPNETLLESIENLPNFDDVVWTMASMAEVTRAPNSYEYWRLLAARLSRIRKILEQAKQDSEQVTAVLMKKLEESADGFEEIQIAWRHEVAVSKGHLSLRRPNEAMKRQVYASAATYLLAELGAREALPLMSKIYGSKDRFLPVSRLLLLYAMHLLATDHPREGLSADASHALDLYLEAGKDVLPKPEIIEVPAWNALYDETDFRYRILRRNIIKDQPKISIRVYPESLKDYEDGLHPMLPVSEQVDTLYNHLAKFIELAYGSN